MHVTGIVENDHTQELIETIKYFLSAENKKIIVTEYEHRFKYREIWHDYWSALIQVETEILLVKIKPRDLDDALKILPIDILIVNDYQQWDRVSMEIRRDFKKNLRQMIIILNSDVINSSDFTDEEKYRLLCYGFRSDSNVTTSSTGEPSISGQFLCCIRESVMSASGKAVEPQEFVMNLENRNPYSILAAASFAIMHDIDLNKLSEKH